MTEDLLPHKMVWPHTKCGKTFIAHMSESPPKIVICPHCRGILILAGWDEDRKEGNYVNGDHYD